jgi:hypothetical protein
MTKGEKRGKSLEEFLRGHHILENDDEHAVQPRLV